MCSFTKAVRSSGRLHAMRLYTQHMPVDQVGQHARRRRTHGGGSHNGQFFRFLGVGFTQVDDLEIMVCGARKDLHGWLGLESINEFCLRLKREMVARVMHVP
jgi:hypothetical protein